MSSFADLDALRRRPPGPYVMHQQWRSLLFVHFALDPGLVRPLVPDSLELDLFDGLAWVGLVFFRMQGVRLRGLPGCPGHTAFPETNVRTYVSHPEHGPGVWFHSLDASSNLACNTARRFFHLPYHFAYMRVAERGERVVYLGDRRSDRSHAAAIAQLGPKLEGPDPDSLETFLIERYQLYVQHESELWSGRVFHSPYPLQQATCRTLDTGLVQALGLPESPVRSVLFSPGVDVKIWPLKRLI